MPGIEDPENLFFWVAYNDLRESRSVGMSAGAVPVSEIKAYADMFGITCPVQIGRLLRFVRALDRVERGFNGDS